MVDKDLKDLQKQIKKLEDINKTMKVMEKEFEDINKTMNVMDKDFKKTFNSIKWKI